MAKAMPLPLHPYSDHHHCSQPCTDSVDYVSAGLLYGGLSLSFPMYLFCFVFAIFHCQLLSEFGWA